MTTVKPGEVVVETWDEDTSTHVMVAALGLTSAEYATLEDDRLNCVLVLNSMLYEIQLGKSLT